MTVDILASGSKANCYALTSGNDTVLLDCGLRFKSTLQKLNYRLPDAILLTHEHCDHAQSVKAFLQRGVDIYTTFGTAIALKIERHNLHVIKSGDTFQATKLFKVTAIPAVHDAAEPVNFIVQDNADRLIYITDTGDLPTVDGAFTKILIEANHTRQRLIDSDIDDFQKQRILNNHLCVELAAEFLTNHPASEVYLIHISARHGDADGFKRLIENATGLTTTAV